MDTIKLDDHLCFKLYVASRLVIKGYAEELAPLELTYPKYLVLVALGETNGLAVGALVERLRLDFGTVSPLLKSLETSGYVDRKRQADDERSVATFITARGRAVLRKAMAIAVQLFCQTEMTIEDLVTLRSSLDDYIGRCQTILDQKKAKPQAWQNAKKVKTKGDSL